MTSQLLQRFYEWFCDDFIYAFVNKTRDMVGKGPKILKKAWRHLRSTPLLPDRKMKSMARPIAVDKPPIDSPQ